MGIMQGKGDATAWEQKQTKKNKEKKSKEKMNRMKWTESREQDGDKGERWFIKESTLRHWAGREENTGALLHFLYTHTYAPLVWFMAKRVLTNLKTLDYSFLSHKDFQNKTLPQFKE